MNRAEYWVLNSVVEGTYPLRYLVDEDIELIFNAPGHGLSRAELVALLTGLFESGDLIAIELERREPVREFVPTARELEAALNGRLEADYALTAQGGARWEAVSQPDWARYVYVGYGTDDALVIGMDRQLVETYLTWQHVQWPEAVVIPETIAWDVLTPWEVTYWKQLPLGHRVQYGVNYGERVWDEPPPEISAWFQQLNHWYTHPFPQAGA